MMVKKMFSKKACLIVISLVITMLIGIFAGYYYSQTKNTNYNDDLVDSRMLIYDLTPVLTGYAGHAEENEKINDFFNEAIFLLSSGDLYGEYYDGGYGSAPIKMSFSDEERNLFLDYIIHLNFLFEDLLYFQKQIIDENDVDSDGTITLAEYKSLDSWILVTEFRSMMYDDELFGTYYSNDKMRMGYLKLFETEEYKDWYRKAVEYCKKNNKISLYDNC